MCGLWATPLAKVIYLIIAVVLLWPLISRFLLRGRHPLAEAAAEAGVPVDGPGAGEPRARDQRVDDGEPRSRVPEAEPPTVDDGRDPADRP